MDDDVAVEVERLRRERDASLKDVINETLREGLRARHSVTKPRARFRTKTFDGKKFLVPFDNAAEAIALLEGDCYK